MHDICMHHATTEACPKQPATFITNLYRYSSPNKYSIFEAFIISKDPHWVGSLSNAHIRATNTAVRYPATTTGTSSGT